MQYNYCEMCIFVLYMHYMHPRYRTSICGKNCVYCNRSFTVSMLALHARHSTHSLRLSNTSQLFVPFVRTLFCACTFIMAATLWKFLSPALQMCTSPDTVHHNLKTHYFQQPFQPPYHLILLSSIYSIHSLPLYGTE